jgi:hypothetical protein
MTYFLYVITKLLQIIQFTKFGYKLWMISANVLGLGDVADFGAQNCLYSTKVDAK